MPDTYTHPDTGEKVKIPEGSYVIRNRDLPRELLGEPIKGVPEDEIIMWRNPPEHTGDELHPSQVPGYEPKFDRLGTHRRVLGAVTDEVDIDQTIQNAMRFLVGPEALGPLNTAPAIAYALARTPDAPGVPPDMAQAPALIERYLRELAKAGLVEKREDDTYAVTDEGLVELRN